GEVAVPVGLVAPTREVGAMLALCRAAVERSAPGAAVRGLRVWAEPAAVRTSQLGLWDLPTAAPMKLLAAVAKVAAIVGPARVGSAALPDAHRPEAFAGAPFAPPDAPARLPGQVPPEPGRALAALRAF